MEVDDLVRDMLTSAASTATSSAALADPLPRRPHTACAGVRPVGLVAVGGDIEDSEESDGGEFDETDGVEQKAELVEARAASSGAGGSAALTPRPGRLRRDKQLLLGGGLWRSRLSAAAEEQHRQAGAASTPSLAQASAGPAASRQSTAGPVVQRGSIGSAKMSPLPNDAAKKLLRQCVFVGAGRAAGGAGGYPAAASGSPKSAVATGAGPTVHPCSSGGRGHLAPSAARLRSHCSWTNYLPMRPSAIPGTQSSAAAAKVAEPAAAKCVAEVCAASSAAPPQRAPVVAAAMSSPAVPAAAPVVAAVSQEAVSPDCENPAHDARSRRRGPKYQVVPGASRPASIPPKKAGAREFVVLEFRTEPRVVPASRSLREDRKRGSLRKDKPELQRFRPDCRGVAEREAAAAGVR